MENNTTMTQYTDKEKLEIANTIIRQMGGAGKLKAMIGARDFLALDSGVQFSFKMNTKMNKCIVELTGDDLYNMSFYHQVKVSGHETFEKIEAKLEKSKKIVESHEGLYNDMLINTFQTTTGLYLSF